LTSLLPNPSFFHLFFPGFIQQSYASTFLQVDFCSVLRWCTFGPLLCELLFLQHSRIFPPLLGLGARYKICRFALTPSFTSLTSFCFQSPHPTCCFLTLRFWSSHRDFLSHDLFLPLSSFHDYLWSSSLHPEPPSDRTFQADFSFPIAGPVLFSFGLIEFPPFLVLVFYVFCSQSSRSPVIIWMLDSRVAQLDWFL